MGNELTTVPDFDLMATRILTPMGFPPDPTSNLVPGLSQTSYSVQEAPIFSSVQGVWDTFKNFGESVYTGAKGVVSHGYTDLKEAASTVYDDVTMPVESALKSTYWYLILGVVVIGGALYFIGKGGALKSVMGR